MSIEFFETYLCAPLPCLGARAAGNPTAPTSARSTAQRCPKRKAKQKNYTITLYIKRKKKREAKGQSCSLGVCAALAAR